MADAKHIHSKPKKDEPKPKQEAESKPADEETPGMSAEELSAAMEELERLRKEKSEAGGSFPAGTIHGVPSKPKEVRELPNPKDPKTGRKKRGSGTTRYDY